MIRRSTLLGSLALLLLCMMLPGLVGCGEEETKTLSVEGSPACQDILTLLALDFNASNTSDYVVTIPDGIGSGDGIEKVGRGEIVLARVERPITESETSQYGAMEYAPFARDMAVFAVSEDVTITGLTGEQLAKIFSGEITNWSEVGGTEQAIDVYVRDNSDSALGIIKDNIAAFSELKFTGTTVYRDYDMITALEEHEGAIGWCTASALAGGTAKAICIDGMDPTATDAATGAYGLIAEYAFVYKDTKLNNIARAFMDYVLSADASSILEGADLLPVTDSRQKQTGQTPLFETAAALISLGSTPC